MFRCHWVTLSCVAVVLLLMTGCKEKKSTTGTQNNVTPAPASQTTPANTTILPATDPAAPASAPATSTGGGPVIESKGRLLPGAAKAMPDEVEPRPGSRFNKDAQPTTTAPAPQ